MTDRPDDSFHIRPSRPTARSGPRGKTFLSSVKAQLNIVGSGLGRTHRLGHGRGAKRGRGWLIARFMENQTGAGARRVVIKTRLVVLKQAGPRSVATHLRYIVRDGASRDGAPAQAYGADTDAADVKAFEQRGDGDRHQFRFIVSPEDGVEFEDLRDFTRTLMQQMESDLGVPLDWVAVDHWDTDNPHSHVVLRGKDRKGQKLIIGREYISHGMRMRASELATEWLGPRTELEIQASQRRDVDQERWTGLDRELQARANDGVVDLTAMPRDVERLRRRSLLVGRLQKLETCGLAAKLAAGRWQLRPDAQRVLRELGERGDIIRTMQQALGKEQRELAIFDGDRAPAITGRIAAKGIDEVNDRPYLVVEGLDGRGHYVRLPATTNLAEAPIGGIVDVRAGVGRAADRNIAAVARDGLYQTDQHLTQLRSHARSAANPEEIVAAHVQRLEALRRAGVVERVADGLWRVPNDLVVRGHRYDQERIGGASVTLHSDLPIDKQVRAIGATWLDRQLVAGAPIEAATGSFVADVRSALQARVEFLVEQGFAERRNQRVLLTRDLLTTLRNNDLESAAKRISVETGRTYRPAHDGESISGIYRRSITLASGRFALLDDALGFSLVPWRPVVEKRLGQMTSAAIHGDHVAWQLGKQRGLSI